VLPKLNRASIEAFSQVFESFDAVDGTNLPPLERCGITIEGASKSGKSTFAAGNPRCIIVKCYDGHPILARARARIINCPDFKTFKKLNLDLMHVAEKQGKDSYFCQICFDPIAALVRWFGEVAVEQHNSDVRDKFTDADGRVVKGAEKAMRKKLVQTPDDFEGYGPWGSIATQIARILIDWGALGWGWIAPIHYQWKAGDFDSGMSWKPNIPPTTADRIASLDDVHITTERGGNDGGDDTFTIRYLSEKAAKRLGSRVPLTGFCELPNYYDKGTPASITTWDYANADYTRACQEFTKDQTRFREAWNAMQQRM
jgi:hypothetical protein